jgi:hypothetical protein
MVEIIGRGDCRAVKRNMFDQMRQSPFTGPPLGDEAAFVAHEQRNAGFMALPR